MHDYKEKKVSKTLSKYIIKNYECSVCGLERNHMKTPSNDDQIILYWRSKMPFHYEPKCINEEIENKKTID